MMAQAAVATGIMGSKEPPEKQRLAVDVRFWHRACFATTTACTGNIS
jgi:hypothetical protein